MKLILGRLLIGGFFAWGTLAHADLTPEQVQQLPAPATHKIDFAKEIQPILSVSCGNCHGRGKSKGDFRIDDRATFLKGGDSGPAVVLGKSEKSLLIELVMGFDPDAIMPAKGSKLKPEQIALLRAWIDQGAPWEKEVWLGKIEPQNLHPRLPQVPQNKKFSNPVDALLDGYFKTNKVKWAAPVSDRAFARRVYLDVIGLLPPATELDQFVSDRRRDKREQLVQKLLNQNQAYADHWLSFWNDLLRNDYKGTGYIDGGRKQITKWLYSSLLTNKPYDGFVAELVNPTPESEGFTKGIVWRGVVNASQVPEMQAAQNISQVFMGINMKCASCHDSFINDLQLSDAYSLANIYSEKPLELFECDKPTGKMAVSKFLYPEFGSIDGNADRTNRMKQLADCVISEKNGRLPRTLVNRLWDRFMGQPFVEVDDMEQKAWNPDLLDWLAEDFVAHNYDVKHLIAQIVTSRAYQLPSVNVDQLEKQYVFRGPSVRRMTAEQLRDALTSVTSIGYAAPNAEVEVLDETTLKKFGLRAETKWIWNDKAAASKAPAEIVYFRKTIHLATTPTEANVVVTSDNSFILYVNGTKIGEGNDFNKPYLFDLREVLKNGANIIAVRAANHLPNNALPKPGELVPGTENPAGLLLYARVRSGKESDEKVMDFATDKTWIWSRAEVSGWEKKGFAAAEWSNAIELGAAQMAPWRLKKDHIPNKLASTQSGAIRAALVNADPLAVALGRPNREQTVTTRPSEATTLQALEMTNGETLADILRRGAEAITAEAKSERELIQQIYQNALGRKPTSAERKLAEELLGKPVNKEGVEDLLWATTMLPEFQLIY
ncbi:MAG: DUF1553 domain-containing protein [Verrucomicrobia bacterium]|nr:DUF1553 domain-containing protein [Verrucomicrobiota bacterium]